MQEHATFSQDNSRSPLSRNNFNDFSNGSDSSINSASAVLHALRQSGSLNHYGNQSKASDDHANPRMPFLSLDAEDTGATGASLAVDKDDQDAAGAAAADIVTGVEKRVIVAIRSGLSQSTLFATATGLGAGMEVF